MDMRVRDSRWAIKLSTICCAAQSPAIMGVSHREVHGGRAFVLRDRKGQHSIRVNRRWRVCFVRDKAKGGPAAVEVVDYR